MVERSAQAVLQWSRWRRWHQAWARYYHARRRQHNYSEQTRHEEVGKPEVAHEQVVQQIDVTEQVWKRLEPLLPPARRVGHPYNHDRRVVLEAIVYVMRTNCGWQHLPEDFPPWETVYSQYTQWRKTGIWDTIWKGLDKPFSQGELQL